MTAMKMVKEIFGRFWALYAMLLFVATMLVFLIPFLLFSYPLRDPVKSNRFVRFARVWMNIFLFGIGCPLRVRGREHFRKGQNYIVLCNHNSYMDVPVSSPAIPGGNKTIAKIEMSRIPLFGLLYKTGSVLVDRKSDSSRKESFGRMKDVLAMGLHMCIYPEGTRNRTAEPLKHFHSGAFRLARDTGKPIIPALIFNTAKVLPPGKLLYAIPHRLEMHFLPAIEVGNETAEQLQARIFELMRAYYQAHVR